MSTATFVPPELFLLAETAAGFLLAHVRTWEEVAQDTAAVQTALEDSSRFLQMVGFSAFHPFSNAAEALANMQAVATGSTTPELLSFLELSLPKRQPQQEKKKKKAAASYQVAVADPGLGKSLVEAGIPATYSANAVELIRGCRVHLCKLAPDIPCLDKFQIGLGHSFSRTKIQFDPNRQDKPIMQSIALVDSLDKNINVFAMRVKEWYGWHFPELSKIVTDNQAYCEVARVIRVRDSFVLTDAFTGDKHTKGKLGGLEKKKKEKTTDEVTMKAEGEGEGGEGMENTDGVTMKEEEGEGEVLATNKDALVAACGSEDVADEVMCASRTSMGQEITEMDMINIEHFARQVILLTTQRSNLHGYLNNKLNTVAPNLQTLLGDALAARLISHAGSLVNLAKAPASTIQILGAEKALFRALKAKTNTPKYGLLFQSSFIGRAGQKSKGRISRCLANKCSLAARVDQFAPDGLKSNSAKGLSATGEKKKKKKKKGVVEEEEVVVARNAFGEAMRMQVEARLASLAKRTT
eukprot:GHVS01018911.1.p1 GENE.GHVS01018911.1~~GHVS01018911.1.p1  ORF type:complete len:587 (-),score=200.07 GHVS01018911.1:139-1710(-)